MEMVKGVCWCCFWVIAISMGILMGLELTIALFREVGIVMGLCVIGSGVCGNSIIDALAKGVAIGITIFLGLGAIMGVIGVIKLIMAFLT